MNSPKKCLISRFLLLAVASIGLTGCYYQKNFIPPGPSIDTETVMEVVLPYAVLLEHEKKLHLEDSTVSYGPGGQYITKLQLNFISQSILELREARELLVDITEGFMDNLNNDPFLGNFLTNVPISTENLEICIKFESYFGLYVDKIYVHWMMLQNDFSYFYAFDMTNEYNIWNINADCWHQRVEPYFKSRQIVNISRAAEEGYQQAHKKPKGLLTNENYEGLESPKTDRTYSGLPY